MNRRTFAAKVLGLFAVGAGVKAAASEGHGCGVVGIGERVEALSLELGKDVEFIKTAKQRIKEAFPQEFYTIGLKNGKAFVESKETV